jgi:glucans biosynthesis protein
LIWNGKGEWLWRPVVNSQRLRLSVFLDHNPRGFGLLQRNRDFSHYQDLEAHYEARPSVWVEPVGNWGGGAVKLIEIPSEAEINDNIVVFWEPDTPLEPGSEWPLTYRLHWCHVPPVHPEIGSVVATRVGLGNDTGTSRKFMIDYVGGKLSSLKDVPVKAEVTTSRGSLHNIVSQFNEMTGGWRTFFELVPEGDDPIELRCFLHLGAEVLTETWNYQWTEE